MRCFRALKEAPFFGQKDAPFSLELYKASLFRTCGKVLSIQNFFSKNGVTENGASFFSGKIPIFDKKRCAVFAEG